MNTILLECITYMNERIPNQFKIVYYGDLKDKIEIITFSKKNIIDHSYKNLNPPGIYLCVNREPYNIISFLLFNEEHENVIGLDILGTCDSFASYQHYLYMALFIYAIKKDISYLVADSNEISYSDLKKYGFYKSETYLPEFYLTYNTYVHTNNISFKKRVFTFFKQKK